MIGFLVTVQEGVRFCAVDITVGTLERCLPRVSPEVILDMVSPAEHPVAFGMWALERGRRVHDGVGPELPGAVKLLATGLASEPLWKMNPVYVPVPCVSVGENFLAELALNH